MQLARDSETGEEVAIKFVPRGSPYLHRAAEREILNHRLLAGHAHIVQFREVRLGEMFGVMLRTHLRNVSMLQAHATRAICMLPYDCPVSVPIANSAQVCFGGVLTRQAF